MNRWTPITALALAGSLLTGAAQAEGRITISSWLGPKHPVNTGGYDAMAETLEEAGWNVRYFQGGALLGAKPSMSGAGDGVADVVPLAMTYFPAEFPHAQVVADMGLATPNNIVAMAAMTEFNLLHCEACLEEYAEQNLVYTGTYSTSPYTIISKEPVRSMADLEGKKMRVPGSLWSRWAQSVGGIEVNVPSSEMFEGLDKGALDIAIQSPGALRSYSLWDTAKYVTDLNLGTYHSLSLVTFNKDFWEGLTDEQRRMMLNEAARAGLDTTLVYTTTDDEVLAEVADHGVEIIEASQEMRDAKDAFVREDVDTIVQVAADTMGIADARPMVEKMQELIDKWSGIVDEVGIDNREGLLQALKTEIYDKLPDDYAVSG